ncbi:MAG: FlgD immunoglobulin-like domain containing protein [Myxococcota bacterium]
MTTIDPTRNVPGAPTAPTQRTANPSATDRVGTEAFLQLLVTQLQNQDPLQPQDGAQFVEQLAQFTHVEQSVRQSEALDVISLQLTGLSANEAVGLIGKDVVVRGNAISFDGLNATGFAATLEGPATETRVTIRDPSGRAVRTMELGPQSAGNLEIPWDGRDDAGRSVPAGSYAVEISAVDDTGTPVPVSQDVRGRVVGVDYDKGFPEIILDSGARAPISDLISVAEGTTAAPPAPFADERLAIESASARPRVFDDSAEDDDDPSLGPSSP